MTQRHDGPWDYDGPPDNIHVFEADRPHMRVCFLTSDGPTEERARLIAAAPDMLAALEAINRMASPDSRTRDDMIRDFDFITARARDAIAKATGPTPADYRRLEWEGW